MGWEGRGGEEGKRWKGGKGVEEEWSGRKIHTKCVSLNFP